MARVDVRAIRREQILDAMEPLVARQGWEQTTFAGICHAAGVSNRVLTYHFKDKEDLLFAVFERAVRRIRENLEPLLPDDVTMEEKLTCILSNGMAQHEKQQLFLLFLHLMAQATTHPEIAARLRDIFSTQRVHLTETIARDAAAGRICADDPETTAACIQSLMLGLMLGRTVLGIDVPSERVLAMMLAFLHHDPHSATANESPPRSFPYLIDEETTLLPSPLTVSPSSERTGTL